MSLTTCLGKAGTHLPASDKSAILERAREYRQEGMSTTAAAARAVTEQLRQVQVDLDKAVKQDRESREVKQSPGRQEDAFADDLVSTRSSISKTVTVSNKGDTQSVRQGNTNSSGQKITATRQGLENFWNWFGDSVAVDEKGRPLVMYHSTNGDISKFEDGRKTSNNYGLLGDVELSRSGIFMTPEKEFSQEYLRSGDGKNVMQVYLKTENPLDLRNGITQEVEAKLIDAGISSRWLYDYRQHDWEMFDNDDNGKNAFVDAVKKLGYDGAIFNETGQDEKSHVTYAAFDSKSIKSATGNLGTFDAASNNITESKSREQTNTPAFKKWFSDSKVVDADGEPLVVYHGTPGDIQEFTIGREGGVFFTADPKTASDYSTGYIGGAENVIPAYLSIKNPYIIDGADWYKYGTNGKLNIEAAKAAGHDGYIIRNQAPSLFSHLIRRRKSDTFVAFQPNQIKSATGNNGDFDAGNKNITKSPARYPETFTAYTGTAEGALLVGGQDPVSNRKLEVLWAGSTRAMADQFQDGEIRKLTVTLRNPLIIEDDAREEIYGRKGHARIADEALKEVMAGRATWDGVVFKDTADGMEVADVIAIFPKNGSVDHAVKVTGSLRYTDDGDQYSGNFNESNITQSPARPEFYSQLERAIEGVPDRLATMAAPQWKLWLDANAGKLGVKKDEIEWSGIKDYLNLRGKDKVTREEVGAFLKEGGLKVKEVVLGDTSEFDTVEKAKAYLQQRFNEDPEERFGYSNPRDYIELADDYSRDDGTPNSVPKYANYTVPGGENYKEMLITLPEKKSVWEVMGKDGSLGIYAEKGVADALAKQRGASVVPRTSSGPADAGYRSSHFDQPNILAHVRMDDRTDADGKKVLFLQEIQSDWGQDGKKKGFNVSVPIQVKPGEHAQTMASIRKAAAKHMMDTANLSELEAHRVADSLPESTAARMVGREAEYDSLRSRAEQDMQNEQSRRGNPSGIPSAPFVGKTEAWVGLALKRAIMHAVESGHEKVAFITGEQAAGLYDLSKQVSLIEYAVTGDQNYKLIITDTNDNNISVPSSLDAEGVESHVGKEIAQKIIDTATSKYQEISGNGLKVGGEGMKSFYDQIVPQVANDVLKKLGGGKMEAIGFVNTPWHLMNRQDQVVQKFATENEARAHIKDSLGGDEDSYGVIDSGEKGLAGQPGFAITPAMREKVSAGVPLFSPARDTSEGMNKSITSSDKSNLPKVILAEEMPPERDGFYRLFHAGSDPTRGGYFTAVPKGGVFDGMFALNGGAGNYGTGAVYVADIADEKVLSSHNLEYELDHKKTQSAFDEVMGKLSKADFDSAWEAVIEDQAHRVDDDDLKRIFREDSVGEASWAAQKARGKVAKALGYEAVEMSDENGTSHLIVSGVPLSRIINDASDKPEYGEAKSSPARDTSDSASQDQAGTPAFKKWFGDSVVTDTGMAGGKPITVYRGEHGDTQDQFQTRSSLTFSENPDSASLYAEHPNDDDEAVLPRVIPVFLRIENPFFNDTDPFVDLAHILGKLGKSEMERIAEEYADEIKSTSSWEDNFSEEYRTPIEAVRGGGSLVDMYFELYHLLDQPDEVAKIKSLGYDGAVYNGSGATAHEKEYRIFDEAQAKSAIGNNGNFDPASNNITESKIREQNLLDGYKVSDFLDSSKEVSWWDKTVGTPYHLAQKNPEFKRVYDAVQNFIGDVSRYATRAADMAPTMLPKLENAKDIFKSPLSAEDVKTLSAPIFEGTLSYARDKNGEVFKTDDIGLAGVVWRDEEMKSMFGMNDRQIGLYREFRKSVNMSIRDLAITDMIHYAGADGKAVRESMLNTNSVKLAADILENHLGEMAGKDPDRAYTLLETARVVKAKADAAQGLIAKGYAPLSRYGDHTVYVTRGEGEDQEQLFFGMYETAREANKASRMLTTEYPDANVKVGTMSKEAHTQFQGITPETMALLGDALGLEEDSNSPRSQMFQEMLKLSKSTRSAMKRMIERKGVEGYSEDAGRVLAGFVYSNSRQASQNLHAGEIAKSASEIPKEKGDLKDHALQLVRHVNNPQSEAAALRGMMFTSYIGGSLASAATNLTQSLTTTLPALSQHFGIGKSGTAMASALHIINKGAGTDIDLEKAMKRAEEEGITAPQETHALMAQAQGRGSLRSGDGTKTGDNLAKMSNGLAKVQLIWGKAFGWAEIMNRKIAFVSAYKLARERGEADPFEFAKDLVTKTQYVMNKGNSPAWARGPVGATLFTFRKFTVNYLEGLERMWHAGEPGSKERAEGRKAFALSLAIMFMLAGAGGFPFADDLDAILDGFMQRVLNKSFSSKQAKKAWVASIIGDAGANFVEGGISSLPGFPIDVSGRLGMGHVVPGIGFLQKKQDHARDIQDLMGVAGDFGSRMITGAGSLAQGDLRAAAESVVPIAIANALKAKSMSDLGYYTDKKGKKIIDTTTTEAILKGIGFQPASVKTVQEATGIQQDLIAQNKIREGEIAALWTRGRVERKPEVIEDARRQLADWNQENPGSKISISASQINNQVKLANMSKAQRLAKAAPKEIRASVKAELARDLEPK